MRLAVLSESETDEAAVRIVLEGILNEATKKPEWPYQLRQRGWPSVREVAPKVLRFLHYRTSTEGLVVVVDANHSPIHQAGVKARPCVDGCRFCSITGALEAMNERLSPLTGRSRIRIAVGLAVPAIEAWFVCLDRAGVNEASWQNGLDEGREPYSKIELKRRAYGAHPTGREQRYRSATGWARQVAEVLHRVRDLFPSGFGPLHDEVASWR